MFSDLKSNNCLGSTDNAFANLNTVSKDVFI